jgi:hypothetical protein
MSAEDEHALRRFFIIIIYRRTVVRGAEELSAIIRTLYLGVYSQAGKAET